MKRLMLLSMIILGSLSFARDFEYNEKRDIIKPLQENVERMNRFTPQEWQMEKDIIQKNFIDYEEFHRELEKSDMGENSER